MKVVDIADQIYRNLSSPSDVSLPSIAAYLRFGVNLGKLNNLLGTSYSINESSLDIVGPSGEEIDDLAASIYELLYSINYYDRQIRNYLGAGSVDITIGGNGGLIEASSDQGTLRFVNRNEISKSFIQVKSNAQTQLDTLVNLYKFGKYRPTHVVGDDENVVATSNRFSSDVFGGEYNRVP